MNREIKFRAWYKPLRKMIDADKLESINFETKVFGVYMDFDGRGFHKLRMSDFELMQYTGLKDKNGVEIYEGDIILLGKAIRHIEYDRGSFTLCAGDRRLSPISDYNSEDKYEIIGNIYEHPHLIGGESDGN